MASEENADTNIAAVAAAQTPPSIREEMEDLRFISRGVYPLGSGS